MLWILLCAVLLRIALPWVPTLSQVIPEPSSGPAYSSLPGQNSWCLLGWKVPLKKLLTWPKISLELKKSIECMCLYVVLFSSSNESEQLLMHAVSRGSWLVTCFPYKAWHQPCHNSNARRLHFRSKPRFSCDFWVSLQNTYTKILTLFSSNNNFCYYF